MTSPPILLSSYSPHNMNATLCIKPYLRNVIKMIFGWFGPVNVAIVCKCMYQARELSGKGESILPLFRDFSIRLWDCSDRMILFVFHAIAAYLLSNAIRSIQKAAKLVCLSSLKLTWSC